MARSSLLVVILMVMVASTAVAFMPIRPSPIRPVPMRAVVGRRQAMTMGVTDAVQAYVNIWSPTIRSIATSAEINPLLIKWFHGANMGIVLFTMATFGSYLGWKIRAGEGDAIFPPGKTARELHPQLLGLSFLFFFLGGQGGLVLLDVQSKPILESPHAISAIIGISLLTIQALLPKLFASNPATRTAHAYLGSATMLLLFVHAALGLQLGLSI